MKSSTLSAFQDEFSKLAQEEGLVSKTQRRLRIAGEFASPVAEGLASGIIAKGLGIKDMRKILAAGGAGAAHGVYRKTKDYAG
jgi:hypothetical protein